jgi:hypothetical protein
VRFYEEPCVPPYPIPVRGHWVIDMNVNGTFLGEYDVERTGNHVDYFSRSGPVRVGVGEWLPRSTLIGTCATSLPLDYTLTGRIVLT